MSQDVFSEGFWDERYGADDRVWSGHPNPQLVDRVAALTPGRALDVGCGEGADAVWLARQGWQVTALDVSAVGLATRCFLPVDRIASGIGQRTKLRSEVLGVTAGHARIADFHAFFLTRGSDTCKPACKRSR